MEEEDEVTEQGRALWRALWAAGFDVRQAWAALNQADRRLLTDELRELARVVREPQPSEGAVCSPLGYSSSGRVL